MAKSDDFVLAGFGEPARDYNSNAKHARDMGNLPNKFM